MRSWTKALWAAAILLLCLLAAQCALASGTGTVTASTTQMRASTKSSSKLICRLKKGTKVTVISTSGSFAKVKYNNKTGYVKKAALEIVVSANSVNTKTTILKTTKATSIYKSASKSSKKIKAVKKGAELVILASGSSWKKVKVGNGVGYVPTSAFTQSSSSSSSAVVKTTQRSAKMYQKASTSAKYVSVKSGTKVTILKSGDTWAKVKINGKGGYMLKTAFTPASSSSSSGSGQQTSSRTSKADKVIDAAMDKLGKPYVYAATGPNSFDCSGFTLYAYKQINISLPHSAYSQGYTCGTKVSRSELKRGDLVCLNTVSDGDLCDHVGIYLGNGQFIHASSGTGKVIISTLDSGYYMSVFSWGRSLF